MKQICVGFAPNALPLVATLALVTSCATLGGTTRHFDEASRGPSVIRSSQRLAAQDHLEVNADSTVYSPTIRARVSRVFACRVLRSSRRVVTTTTTQTANRLLFGAEITFAIVGVVITGASAASAAKACPSGNPDTCDISKATALFAGAVTAPFLISTLTDLAFTGGTERSTKASVVIPVQEEYVEECGREPASHVPAKLVLPGGEAIEQRSTDDGSLLFEVSGDQLARVGSPFQVELVVEGAFPQSISVRRGE